MRTGFEHGNSDVRRPFFYVEGACPKLSYIPGLLVHALISGYLTTTPYDGAIKGGLHLARVWRARGRVSDRTDFFLESIIYRLRTPLTAIDPVDPRSRAGSTSLAAAKLWFYTVDWSYS